MINLTTTISIYIYYIYWYIILYIYNIDILYIYYRCILYIYWIDNYWTKVNHVRALKTFKLTCSLEAWYTNLSIDQVGEYIIHLGAKTRHNTYSSHHNSPSRFHSHGGWHIQMTAQIMVTLSETLVLRIY